MILNKTPIRTSKNFEINDIEISDLDNLKNIRDFDSLTIMGDTENFKISNETSKLPFTYGIDKDLENQVYKNGNCNLKIEDKKSGILNLEFNLNEENENLMENIEIVSNTKSKTTIIIKYTSDGNKEYFHNGLIRVNGNSQSKINIVVINMLNNKSKNLLSIENKLKEEANLNYCIVDFGGKTSITNYYSNLEGNDAKSNLYSIYLGTENQLFDINYISEIRGQRGVQNIEVQGALSDKAVKNFKGTIDFKKGCKKAKGNENEFCMLLSDTAKSKALPMLLCTEEDVEGSHSTSAGKAEKEMLFYIMSRGFSKKEAMKLIVKAKFNKIIETIKDETLKEKIINEIDKRLD